MNPIKKRIYYDLEGVPFFVLDLYSETSVDKDIRDFKQLSERNRDAFNVLEVPYGAYAEEFAACDGYRVNVATRKLEFRYPDPNQPGVPQPYKPPLSTTVNEQMDYLLEMDFRLSMVELGLV